MIGFVFTLVLFSRHDIENDSRTVIFATIFALLTQSNIEIALVSFPDWIVMAFVSGFLVQEVLAVCREGFHVRTSPNGGMLLI